MADLTLTGISMENPSTAVTYEAAFYTGAAVGDLVTPAGVKVAAITDEVGGVVVRVGDSVLGNQNLILQRGIVRAASTMGVTADTPVFSDGDGTASTSVPAGAAGTAITELGQVISTTRFSVNPIRYQKGA